MYEKKFEKSMEEKGSVLEKRIRLPYGNSTLFSVPNTEFRSHTKIKCTVRVPLTKLPNKLV